VRSRNPIVIGASIGGLVALLFGLGVPETYQWFCPGSFDNYCSEARSAYFGWLLPPKITVMAYTLTGLVLGAVLGRLLVLGFRSMDAHRVSFSAVGLGVVLGTLAFIVTH
jgi:hypothetical protein